MHAAVIGTTVTTPDTKPFRLFINNEDVLKGSSGEGVSIDSIEWESGGTGSPARLQFVHSDPAKVRTFTGGAEVRFWDQSNDTNLFGGYLVGRTSTPAFGQQGRATQLIATDYSLELDSNIVQPCRYPAGLTDQTIIQGLCGRFLKGTLSFAAASVASTNTNMPAMKFELSTLRTAL